MNLEEYIKMHFEFENQQVDYRQLGPVVYCQKPADETYESLVILVPEAYFHNESMNGYNRNTAPIFMPNTVGGYMPGKPQGVGLDRHGKPNAAFYALLKGYVVVVAGSRGRGLKDENGKYYGLAPAFVVDQKAAVRFLREFASQIPGDTEKIITSGTSAGGALSALMGATGNHPDYFPYLEAIGAYNQRDDVYGSQCYCPITNLDHADMAYEWSFNGVNKYHGIRFHTVDGNAVVEPMVGYLDDEQISSSNELKKQFIEYVNSLELRSPCGCTPLILDENGNGAFKDYIISLWCDSANYASDEGKDLSEYAFLKWKNGKVVDVDFDAYMNFSTRMKTVPAFDHFDLHSPENEVFGFEYVPAQHFTKFSYDHSTAEGNLMNIHRIQMMNPMYYLDSSPTKYWRIRHGALDRDTSLAIPAILALKLIEKGKIVDFFSPWGIPHSGDYDLDDLFSWIDDVCK